MDAIVAVSNNWGIGKDGKLLFRISADLKRFKAITTDHTVIMGRKTLATLPGGRGLINRRNLVLSRNPDFQAERAEVLSSVDVSSLPEDTICIGGDSVYKLFYPEFKHVFVTKIYAEKEADAFFPNLDDDPDWSITSESEIFEEDGLRYQFIDYTRKNP